MIIAHSVKTSFKGKSGTYFFINASPIERAIINMRVRVDEMYCAFCLFMVEYPHDY